MRKEYDRNFFKNGRRKINIFSNFILLSPAQLVGVVCSWGFTFCFFFFFFFANKSVFREDLSKKGENFCPFFHIQNSGKYPKGYNYFKVYLFCIITVLNLYNNLNFSSS